MENNPFDYQSITDIETRARVLRAQEMGNVTKDLFRCVGRVFRKLVAARELLARCNHISANSDYYTKNPEEVKKIL